MDTAAVSYRIVDFLKTNPPFNAMSDTDLLALTTAGRVKFYEANDFILWHGEPHKAHVFVIQQGTVSLWDDSGERATLQDIRGGSARNRAVQRRPRVPAVSQSRERCPDLRVRRSRLRDPPRTIPACARARRGV